MASDPEYRPTRASQAAAISSAIVRIMSEYTGRGPTKARTLIQDDVVLVLMQNTLTKAERSLLANEEGDFVLAMRQRFHLTMREDFIAAVEMVVERKVIAFMAANHLEPDMAAKMFVLEPRAQQS